MRKLVADLPIRQLVRYAAIGIASNLAGYLVYLLITWLGGEPKLTMTLLYGVGATVSYFANRKLTFAHQGSMLGSGARYVVAHLGGYLINLAMLYALADRMGHPHQLVQAAAIFVVAAYLFVALKFFVFSHIEPAGETRN